MKARTEHGAFVAAARWMITSPDWCHIDVRRNDGTVEIHVHEVCVPSGTIVEVVVIRDGIRDVWHPKSIRQAVDYLVDAEILPAEHASWRAMYEHAVYEKAVDYDGELIGMLGDSIAFSDANTPDDWEPLYRRVVTS